MSAVLATRDSAGTEIEHGTLRTYHGSWTSKGCRCVLCRAANAAYHRDYLARHPEQVDRANARRLGMSPSVPPWPGLSKIVPRSHKIRTTKEMKAARARAEEILADAA